MGMFDKDSDFENRFVTPEVTRDDSDAENSLRPKTLGEYLSLIHI